MLIGSRDIDGGLQDRLPVQWMTGADLASAREDRGKNAGRFGGDMHDNKNGRGKIGREAGDQRLQGSEGSRGASNYDNVSRMKAFDWG